MSQKPNMDAGKLIVFSAPSGSGKTTVVKHLLEMMSDHLAFSVSATTRKKRAGEVDGVDYYFLDENTFKQRLKEDAFLEHEEVYEGLFYGTLMSEVERIWKSGKHVLFDVDVVGGLNIKKKYPDKTLAVFLRPPSIEVLMERLKNRQTEVEHQLQERIEKARKELEFESQFDVVIVNDILQETFTKAEKVVYNFINT
jgi:guanylate kinase